MWIVTVCEVCVNSPRVHSEALPSLLASNLIFSPLLLSSPTHLVFPASAVSPQRLVFLSLITFYVLTYTSCSA